MNCDNSAWNNICECLNAEGLRWKEANQVGYKVGYFIDDSYSQGQSDAVRKAFADISAIACIDFEEKDEATQISFYTKTLDEGTLAIAEYAYMRNDPECIVDADISKNSLYQGAFDTNYDYFYAIMIHEILHALGIDHSPNATGDYLSESIGLYSYASEFGSYDLEQLFMRHCKRFIS